MKSNETITSNALFSTFTRMGISRKTRTPVYWISGYGYFTSPTCFRLIEVDRDGVIKTRAQGQVIIDGKSKTKSRDLNVDDKEDTKRRILDVLTYIASHGRLYSVRVSSLWLRGGVSISNQTKPGYKLISIASARGVMDEYPPLPNCAATYKQVTVRENTPQFNDTIKELTCLKNEMIKSFNIRYKLTPEKALVFQDKCPELIDG